MQRLTLGYRYQNGIPRPTSAQKTAPAPDPPPALDPPVRQNEKQTKSGLFGLSLSPDRPLFSLGRRKICPDDLLLLVLLIALWQDKADPSVLAALFYLLASD